MEIWVSCLILAASLCLGGGLVCLDQDSAGRGELLRAGAEERRGLGRRTGASAGALPGWLMRLIGIMRPVGLAITPADAREALRKELRAAGQPWGLEVADYLGLRCVLVGGGVLLGLLMESLPLTGLMGIAGWLGLGQWLGGRIAARQAQIRSDLPDFLDCVSISLAAGAPVDTALRDVTDRFDGPLQEEMQQVLAQMALGVPRQQALRQVLEHNRTRELEAVILALVHGMQLGVPLSEALQAQARAMRHTRAQRARQLAGAAAPRITLVSTLLITPAVLALIIGLLVLNFLFNDRMSGFQRLVDSW